MYTLTFFRIFKPFKLSVFHCSDFKSICYKYFYELFLGEDFLLYKF